MIWCAAMPVAGWICSGMVKFLVNVIRFGRSEARIRAGNGGFPSTHTTVVAAPLSYIGFTLGIKSPAFGLGVALLMITAIDAMGIRKTIGEHASRLNKGLKNEDDRALRESQGHTAVEVFGGLALGVILGAIAATL